MKHPVSAALEDLLGGSTSDALEEQLGRETSETDELLALLAIYDLWMAPLDKIDGREVFQHHPAVAALKSRLEASFVDRLDRCIPSVQALGDAPAALRRIAAKDLLPPVYEWVASTATYDELVRFVTVEGGPDADFDDLVAIAQVGVRGDAKLALAANYWDEMGRGDIDRVHTVLHDGLVAAIEMPQVPRGDLPASALQRKAVGGLLVTNRSLQLEAIGALGLIEMQAGPRCRAVVRGLTRVGAPPGALPFYEEHARADPVHGKVWLERVVRPLAKDPRWGARLIRGAQWRQEINRRFFDDMLAQFTDGEARELSA